MSEASPSDDSHSGGLIYRLTDVDRLREATGLDLPTGRRDLCFIPAAIAQSVVELTCTIAIVNDAPPFVGVSLADTRVLTVLWVGSENAVQGPGSLVRPGANDAAPLPGSDRAVLCSVGEEEIAIAGGFVEATGIFEATSGGVIYNNTVVPELAVVRLYLAAEGGVLTAASRARRQAGPSATAERAPNQEPEGGGSH